MGQLNYFDVHLKPQLLFPHYLVNRQLNVLFLLWMNEGVGGLRKFDQLKYNKSVLH